MRRVVILAPKSAQCHNMLGLILKEVIPRKFSIQSNRPLKFLNCVVELAFLKKRNPHSFVGVSILWIVSNSSFQDFA